MNLEQYLEGLRDCPDEWVVSEEDGPKRHMLDLEFGIYDNYYIPFNIDDMIILAEALKSSGKFKISSPKQKDMRGDKGDIMYLNYVPGIVIIQVRSRGGIRYPPARDGLEYNHYLTAHPYLCENDTDHCAKWKVMSNAIIDLVEVMKGKQIPFCLASSWHGSKVKSGSEVPNYVPKKDSAD